MRCRSRQEGFHRNFVAVRADGCEPLHIGSQDRGAMHRQTFQHLRVGVAERVFEAIRNDRESGRNSLQKRLDAGRIAAVVAHFQDVGPQRLVCRPAPAIPWAFPCRRSSRMDRWP